MVELFARQWVTWAERIGIRTAKIDQREESPPLNTRITMSTLEANDAPETLSERDAAEWLATMLWERAEQAGKEVQVVYYCGELRSSPETPTLSIGVMTDSGVVHLIEDLHARLWVCCSSIECATPPASRILGGIEPLDWLERGLVVLTGDPGVSRPGAEMPKA